MPAFRSTARYSASSCTIEELGVARGTEASERHGGRMTSSRYAILAAFVGLAIVGSACTQKPADEAMSPAGAVDKPKAATGSALDATKKGLDKALETTKVGTDRALDATGKGVATAIDQTQKAAQATKKIAGRIATK